ncbi:MAG: sugar ABC transporter permease, partial [Octadecabacter sp.]|nr:sugar ABC transporter permease [Octadecabacter sp.]
MANRTIPRLLQTPAVLLLLFWMIVPLAMTLFYSFIRYVLNSTNRPEWTTPSFSNWRGFGNYEFVLNSKDFLFAIKNSLFIVTSILTLTVVLGVLIAVLINRSFPGRGIVRVLLISACFFMPAVDAVLWINKLLGPVGGHLCGAVGGRYTLAASMQDAPLVGWFFNLWPVLEPISFRATQT